MNEPLDDLVAEVTDRAVPADQVTDRNGRQWWNCPNCHRNIGQITRRRLVIIVKRDMVASLPLAPGLVILCARCHTSSALIESTPETHAAGK